jgi:hypothetical protein
MNVSEVLDIEGSFEPSKPLEKGEKVVIQEMKVTNSEKYNCPVAEIKTTDGLRYSFAKTIIGQADSDKWKDIVEMCVKKDASNGLDAYVVELFAEGSGRPMLALSWYPPKSDSE